VATQVRTQTMRLSPPTIRAIGCFACMIFSQIANAQLPVQEKCAAEAKETFQEVEREYVAESKRLEPKVELASSTHKSHTIRK